MKITWYLCTIFFSIVLLFIGNFYANRLINLDTHEFIYRENIRATITDIIFIDEHRTTPVIVSDDTLFYNTIITISFLAQLENGETVSGIQSISDFIPTPSRQLQIGDRVILQYFEVAGHYELIEFVRINQIIIFGIVVFAIIILFGKLQGLNSLVALGFTIAFIFFVFVPAILNGANIYLWAIFVGVYSTITTMMVVIGPTKKAVSTIVGTLFSIAVISVITVVMTNILGMTGVVAQESAQLMSDNPNIDLNAIMFAGIVIGAIGAIMDVCMSLSSALFEFSKTEKNSFREIYTAGISIGKDILGTMANTLVLAYIGSYLAVILTMTTVYSNNITNIFYREGIIAELLRALAGVSGIFLAIPITTLICAFLYQDKSQHTLQ